MAKPILTHAELLRVLDYSPETGLFYWKVRLGARGKPGSVAGTLTDRGYRKVCIGGKIYALHRLALFHATGEMPTFDVDHVNRNRADNRLVNLRRATNAENQQNRVTGVLNRSGVLCVYWLTKQRRWLASIMVDGKSIHLGYFSEKEDAVAARTHAELERFTHSPPRG